MRAANASLPFFRPQAHFKKSRASCLPVTNRPVSARVIGDAIQYVQYFRRGSGAGQQSAEIDHRRDPSARWIDADNVIGTPHVGQNLAFHVLQFIQPVHDASAHPDSDSPLFRKGHRIQKSNLAGAIAHDQRNPVSCESPPFASVSEFALQLEIAEAINKSLLVAPGKLKKLSAQERQSFREILRSESLISFNRAPVFKSVFRREDSPFNPVLSKKQPSRYTNPCVKAPRSCGKAFTIFRGYKAERAPSQHPQLSTQASFLRCAEKRNYRGGPRHRSPRMNSAAWTVGANPGQPAPATKKQNKAGFIPLCLDRSRDRHCGFPAPRISIAPAEYPI